MKIMSGWPTGHSSVKDIPKRVRFLSKRRKQQPAIRVPQSTIFRLPKAKSYGEETKFPAKPQLPTASGASRTQWRASRMKTAERKAVVGSSDLDSLMTFHPRTGIPEPSAGIEAILALGTRL
jgi:hypothetical protein